MESFATILKNTTKIREIILKLQFLESQNNLKNEFLKLKIILF
jgi:hypothetical protein